MKISTLVSDLILDRTLLGGLVGGFVVYLFSAEVGLQHLPLMLRALVYGGGCAAYSLVKGVVAARTGVRGVASFDPRVTYESKK